MTQANHLLCHLLRSVDPSESAASSFDDYHVPGLSYVNLLRTPRLTAKLYIARPGTVAPNADGYVVNPHNHGYCFDTFVLAGSMINVSFREHVDGDQWTEFAFQSALKGQPRFDIAGMPGLVASDGPRLDAGDSYYLDEKTIHTIRIPSDRLTILFLLQYEDMRAKTTRLFTRDGLAPSLAGLYKPMTTDRAKELIDVVRGATTGEPK